ncbi:MAG: hypothetical protein AAFV90_24240 [Cyanobacteria bacterium J06634_5]
MSKTKKIDITPRSDRTDKAKIKELLPEIDEQIRKGYYLPAIYASLKEKQLIKKSEANFKRQYYALKKEQSDSSTSESDDVVNDESEPVAESGSIISGFDPDEQERLANIVFEKNKARKA